MENKVYGYIYMITNLINNKVYVGQTIQTIKKRFQDHIQHSKNNNPIMAITRAIQKYGKENFTIEQIDIAYSQKELNLIEGIYISWFRSLTTQNGYNITNIINGKGKTSKETKEKLREKAIEPHKIVHIINLGKLGRGISHSGSTSKYCGVSLIRNKWTALYRFNGKQIHLGTFLTEEEAAKARDIAEIQHIGSNAILNFPELREQYLNGKVIINKCKRKKCNSDILGVYYCNTYKKWGFYKNGLRKRFKTKEEAEQFALNSTDLLKI